MARKYHQGKYTPKNPRKYVGTGEIVYRSSWELGVFRWLDFNDDVIAWNSEAVVIPYVDPNDNQIHRYYVDLAIKYRSGNTVLVEIKPQSQTVPPKKTKNKKTLVENQLTWDKNQAKWAAAERFALLNGAKFQVWGEDVLQALGIPVMR